MHQEILEHALAGALQVLAKHGLGVAYAFRDDACRILAECEGGAPVEVRPILPGTYHQGKATPGRMTMWTYGKYGIWETPCPDDWPDEVSSALEVIQHVLEHHPEPRSLTGRWTARED